MKVIYRGRGTGKTTELIELASNTEGSVIVTPTYNSRKHLIERAYTMGYKISPPITPFDLITHREKYKDSTFLIDDAEVFIRYIMNNYFGVKDVKAIVLNDEME